MIPEVSDYDPRIDLTFRITEGEQYKVNTFTFNNDRTISGKSSVGNRPLNLRPAGLTPRLCCSRTAIEFLLAMKIKVTRMAIDERHSRRRKSALGGCHIFGR